MLGKVGVGGESGLNGKDDITGEVCNSGNCNGLVSVVHIGMEILHTRFGSSRDRSHWRLIGGQT